MPVQTLKTREPGGNNAYVIGLCLLDKLFFI